MKAEIFRTYEEPVSGPGGGSYTARICGRLLENGIWEGWLEFTPVGGGPVLRSPRETTQSDRRNFERWAHHLRRVYVEGSLVRTLRAEEPKHVPHIPLALEEAPRFDGPAPAQDERQTVPPDQTAVNPFLLYRRGEPTLRTELQGLSTAELRALVQAYRLDAEGDVDPSALARAYLIELIVQATRDRSEP